MGLRTVLRVGDGDRGGEVTGRRVAAIDNQPAYIDVACLRWQRLTGQLPMLVGEPVDFTPATST